MAVAYSTFEIGQLQFLMVDGDQAFSRDRCNKANNTFLKGPGSPVIYVSVKRDSLQIYVLKYFQNFSGSVW